MSTNTTKAIYPLNKNHTNVNALQVLIIAISAIVTITIASTSSPIYPFNTWDDANAYFTVGKSFWNDLLPYRDLFDHKGPFLYVIYSLATLISSNTFIGIYFFEIIACFGFLFFIYKTLKLYFDKAIYFIPFLSLMLYTSTAFERGGGPEEFALPFIAYALFILIKALKEEKLPSLTSGLIIGITSGFIFWMKFNLVAFYVGWIIAPFILAISKKILKDFFKFLGMIIIGVAIATAPFIIYFGIKESLSEMFNIYLFMNTFEYSKPEEGIFIITLIKSLGNGLYKMFKYSIASSLLLLLGIVWCILKENKYVMTSYISMFVMLFIGVYGNGRDYEYYPFIFSVFAVIGIAAIIFFVDNKLDKKYSKLARIFLVVLALLLTFPAPNMYLLFYKQSDLPHYQVKEAIDNSGIESPTLLNYGMLDAGFYTTTGIVPNTKYYYCPNVMYYEFRAKQDELIADGKVDFIVAVDPIKEGSDYEIIGTYEFFSSIYLLYQHTSK